MYKVTAIHSGLVRERVGNYKRLREALESIRMPRLTYSIFLGDGILTFTRMGICYEIQSKELKKCG